MVRRLLVLALLAACGDNAAVPSDAPPGPDALIIIDTAPTTDGPPLAWIDFAASGCELVAVPAADAGPPALHCRGPAPLTVQFAAISSGPVLTWAWSFGDGNESDEATPSHIYATPRSYDVALSVAGVGGTATAVRTGFIEVMAAPLGAACQEGTQCASGDCLCGVDGVGCPSGLATGLCTAPCGPRCAGGVCATLGNDEPWRGDWCLRPCGGDEDCPAGRICEVVASKGGGWVEACLPADGLAALGASCSDVAGFDDGLCASGDCLPVGVRGVCTTGCSAGACPEGTRCAKFGNSTQTCLVECGPTAACNGDPWLACEAPGASGPLGFMLVDPPSATVCAPRRCTKAEQCPGGTCVAGHCGPIPP